VHKKIMMATTAMFSLLLTSVGVPGAQAATTNLTYGQFVQDSNWKEMSLAMETFFEEMRSTKSMNMTTTMNSDMGATVIGRYSESATTSGNNFKYRLSDMNLLSPSSSASQVQDKDYGYVNGVYFGTLSTYELMSLNSWNYAKSTAARLGKPKAKYFSTRKASLLQYIHPFNTASVISAASRNMSAWTLVSQGLDNPKTRCSEVTKTANSLNALDTDYTFDFKIPSGMGSNSFTYVHSVVTTSSDGQRFSVKVDAESPWFGIGIITTAVNTVINLGQNTVETPDLKAAIDLQAFADMSTKINIETALTTAAKSISAKAKSIATKAKKKLTPANIVLATKQSKSKYPAVKTSSIKGGVKLSFKYGKITGNICMTVVNSAAKIKSC